MENINSSDEENYKFSKNKQMFAKEIVIFLIWNLIF